MEVSKLVVWSSFARYRWGQGAVVFLFLTLFVFGSSSTTFASTPIDNGYFDFTYPSGTGKDNHPTGDKPESKLWWHDGSWWGVLWSTSGNAYHIYKLTWATQSWIDTGTVVDSRKDSRADVLSDGNKLYIVSHIFSGKDAATGTAAIGERGEFRRFTYSSGSYSLSVGPIEVNQAKSETLVMDKDSAGTLWITYVHKDTGSYKVWVNYSEDDGNTWGTPYALLDETGLTTTSVDRDDVSSVITYGNYTGVMWSDQSSSPIKMYFAVHSTSDANGDANTWSVVTAYSTSGDDHISLKSLQSGSSNIFAAVKTSTANIILLACTTGNCTSASNWTVATAYDNSKSPTRPLVLLDTSNNELYLFTRLQYASGRRGIYYKKTPISSINFSASDIGTAFITDSSHTDINDPTSTKQTVNSNSGLVVQASDGSDRVYVHNCLTLTGITECPAPVITPTISFRLAAYTASENSGTATIEVDLSHAGAQAIDVDYSTAAGTATSGKDYQHANGTLHFAVGETTKSFLVNLLDDPFEREQPRNRSVEPFESCQRGAGCQYDFDPEH